MRGKHLDGYFKEQNGEISKEKTLIWLRKENPQRETGSLQITAQNNAIRTNYIKAKIDNARLNS